MTQQYLQQTQVPLATMPITGQTVVQSAATPGVQAAVPRDPTAMMQVAALPIPGQPVAQPVAQPPAPVAQLFAQPAPAQFVAPQAVPAPMAPQVPATPLPAFVQLPPAAPAAPAPGVALAQLPPAAPVPGVAPAVMPPVAPVGPVPITADNLAALGHVPPAAPVAPVAPAAVPVAPVAAPVAPVTAVPTTPVVPAVPVGPNGQPPNGQAAPQMPIDLVRSDDPKVQGLLNRQRDQLTQAYEAAAARANMAEGDRLRAETADAQALSQRYAAVAVEAQQSYQLASALMSSGAQLQPNAQALIESQVKPLLAQGVPAPQALQHVAQHHPYLFQPAQPAPGQPGALPTPEAILGIAAPPATPQVVPMFQQPVQQFAQQVPQTPQAPQYGAPVQAVFQNPSTGFMGQGAAAPGGPPAPVAQPGQPVDLRTASSKEFRDWKLANGIHV